MPTYFDPIKGDVEYIPEAIVKGGDVEGPASSTDNAVARFDGTTGKIIQNSGVIVDDTNNVTVPGVVLASNGSNAAPSYSFSSASNTGFTLPTSNSIALVANGTERFRLANNVFHGSGTNAAEIGWSSGVAAAPNYRFVGDNNTGMYRVAANTLGFSTGGTNALTLGSDQTSTFAAALLAPDGSNAAPSYSFTGDTDTGIYSDAADTLKLATGGADAITIADDQTSTFAAALRAPTGSTAAPAYSFSGDNATGIYMGSLSNLHFAVDGFDAIRINEGGLVSFLQGVRVSEEGTAANPSFIFGTGLTTGLYSPAENTLGFSTDGTQAIEIDSDQKTKFSGQVLGVLSGGSEPSFAFDGAAGTGIFNATNALGIAVNGGMAYRVFSTAIVSSGVNGTLSIRRGASSPSGPVYSFSNFTGWGMGFHPNDDLHLSTNGAIAISIDENQVTTIHGDAEFPNIGTTASAANATFDGDDNSILLSTSSLRYKKEVEDIEKEYSNSVLNLRPVWYRSKAKKDRKDWGWYGLIAEEVAEIDPRLVHWRHSPEDFEIVEVSEMVEEDREYAEDPPTYAERKVKKRILKEGAELVPDGVQYERVTVLLLDVVKRLEERVKQLEAKLKE